MKTGILAASIVCAFFAAPSMAVTCLGTCGTLGADGVVTAPPIGGPSYSYVATGGGVAGAGQIQSAGGTNGSELVTSAFSANAGDALNFAFNYVTSDGAGYADYAFAELLTSTSNHVAYLFTARTTPSGDTSPGFALPANDSTLDPASTPIIGGAPVWSALGGYSGTCYNSGCGYTGWIKSDYTIAASGSYLLRFGVTNYSDTQFDSGLAFAGVTIAGNPVPTGGVPEPASWAMFISGFGMIGSALRSRKRAPVRFA